MLARIANDLRRCVKPHRLAIQQRRRERRRILPLDPARHVDEVRETRRMALGKAIFAKPLDLVETAPRELGVVAALDHPPDHLVLQQVDRSARPERRHRFAQLVGLGGREFGRVRGDLHRLLLEDRHPHRPPEDPLQLVDRAMRRVGAGEGHRLLARPPLEEGMDHVALGSAPAGRSPLRSPDRRSSAASTAAACSSAPGSRPGTRRAYPPCTACRRLPASSRGTVASSHRSP